MPLPIEDEPGMSTEVDHPWILAMHGPASICSKGLPGLQAINRPTTLPHFMGNGFAISKKMQKMCKSIQMSEMSSVHA